MRLVRISEIFALRDDTENFSGYYKRGVGGTWQHAEKVVKGEFERELEAAYVRLIEGDKEQ
jgi:hypothetical protein